MVRSVTEEMKFVKYASIENSYRKAFITKIIWENMKDGEWVVTEKIHGANFSLWTDGEMVRMAKRTSFIDDEASFFGIQHIKSDLILNALDLHSGIVGALLSSLDPSKEIWEPPPIVTIYGELFGGTYPHPEVEKVANAKKVQKGVYYCPQNDFIVFDIAVDRQFLSFKRMRELVEGAGFNCVEELFRGPFRACLNYRNDFPSTIYKRYDLPKINDNICEGIVIRPEEPRFLFDHSRVMLKSKNAKFAESASRKEKVKHVADLTGGAKEALDAMIVMVTDNRYDSVVSKMGEVAPKDFGPLQGAMMKDILSELMKEGKPYLEYNNLEKAEKSQVNKSVGRKVAELIRRRLIEV